MFVLLTFSGGVAVPGRRCLSHFRDQMRNPTLLEFVCKLRKSFPGAEPLHSNPAILVRVLQQRYDHFFALLLARVLQDTTNYSVLSDTCQPFFEKKVA